MIIDLERVTETDANEIVSICYQLAGVRPVVMDYRDFESPEAVEILRTIFRKFGYIRECGDEETEVWNLK